MHKTKSTKKSKRQNIHKTNITIMRRNDLLTNTEHQIMLHLWSIAKKNPKFILVRSILECYPDNDRPAYTTLATFIKILVNKKFVSVKKVGNLLTIKPSVSQDAYVKKVLKYNLSDFFENDEVKMVEFLVQNSNLTPEQKEEMKALL